MTDKPKPKEEKKEPWVVRLHMHFSDYILFWMEFLMLMNFVYDGAYIADLGAHIGSSWWVRFALHVTQGLICMALTIGFYAMIRKAYKIKLDYPEQPQSRITTVMVSYFVAALICAAGMFAGPFVLFDLTTALSVGTDISTGLPYPSGPTLVRDASLNCGVLNFPCWIEYLSANELIVGPYVSMVVHYAITLVVFLSASTMILMLPFKEKPKEKPKDKNKPKDKPKDKPKNEPPAGNPPGSTPPPAPDI